MEIVNVIEILGGVLSSIDSFIIREGIWEVERQRIIDKAEKLFRQKAEENDCSPEDIDGYLDLGGWDNENGYEILISWSNVIL